MHWSAEYESRAEYRNLSKKFSDYSTVDWFHEKYQADRHRYQDLTRTNETEEHDIELANGRPESSSSQLYLLFEKISRIQWYKLKILSEFKIFIVLTVIGVLIGVSSVLVNLLGEFLIELKLKDVGILSFFYYTALSLLYSFIACYLCVKVSPNSSGSGISEVKCIVQGFQNDSFLSLKTYLVKILALPFTIMSGLNVGKEGPSVHYASCIGNFIYSGLFFINDLEKADIVTCAAGSGVAVAFGSPIGGVLFSIEEINNEIKMFRLFKIFFTSLIAITTFNFFDPFENGKIIMFQVQYVNDWRYNEVGWFIVIGIFGGLYGILVSKLNIKYVYFRQNFLMNHPIFEVLAVTLVTSILSYWNILMRLDMTNVIALLFDECSGKSDNDICASGHNFALFFQLFYSLVVRCILVIISYGCKVPCGIFVPSITIGATFGKLLGLFLETDNGIKSGTYAFLGAGAALSGITGLTFTVVVIMYELTGAVKYIIPNMIVIIVVKVLSELFGNGFGGIADQMIKFNGMPFIDVKEDHSDLFDKKLCDVMVKDVVTLEYFMSKPDVETALKKEFKEYPIVQQGILLGVIAREELQNILHDEEFVNHEDIVFIGEKRLKELGFDYNTDIQVGTSVFEESIKFENITVNINTPLSTIFDIFFNIGNKFIFVEDDGLMVGLINKKDLIKFENFEHFKHHGNVFVNERDINLMSKVEKYL